MKEEIKKFVADYLKKYPIKMPSISPAAGKVYDHHELENLVEAAMEGWWTDGRWVLEFEEKIKKYLGVKYVVSCNSGSSANLLAFSALCSRRLGKKQIKEGDEVITVAAGFPTTVNPIITNRCIPVFVDVDLMTKEIDVKEMQKALSKKTKAVMVAHTLGNPFELDAVKKFCDKHDLWLVEDNCDALGSKYKGKFTGTFGHIATVSCYPAHQITTAEGGFIFTDNLVLDTILRSIRDWGRHCWCPTGKDNTCEKRFCWKLGKLPKGYDHKFTYGELGYNLKMTDLTAAIGVAQMDKLDKFTKIRKKNFSYMYEKMKAFEEYFYLPQATKDSNPSWFGFTLTIKDPERLDRADLLDYMNQNGTSSRLVFAGNLIKQPYFVNNPDLKYRIVGDLKNTDYIMENSFWIGIYPAIDKEKIDRTVSVFAKYLQGK
ncbi:lipopolysaccharide biosynthesis protein RfbH [Candidatus Peregrinibacteria bacterium]|nr:lipopolysaccharide biosynthesis protein RfbH [Candidatus Peregrinibacteria bacterium]